MLSIGEFSKICNVSTKTLRYYAEIGLILPSEINEESGYRYYSIKQLEIMLFINRLKSFRFSLEEIKRILDEEENQEEVLYTSLLKKKQEIRGQVESYEQCLKQLEQDIHNVKQGVSMMSYLDDIDVQLVEVPSMCLLSIRKSVHRHELPDAYAHCFRQLSHQIEKDTFTINAPAMVLFHSAEFSPLGIDIEFAIPIKECVKATRDFHPGVCLKTTVNGAYSELSSIYAKQIEWAEKEGYIGTDALFEVYVSAPSQVQKESDLVTEIYFPVKKKT